MGVKEVADIIGRIANGLEGALMNCMIDNSAIVVELIKEQLWAGQYGDGKPLSPSYDSDPFFDEPGHWYHNAKGYIAWKRSITPPTSGVMLGLPPRPDNIPNLFIDGTFYKEINISEGANMLVTDPGNGNGPDIEEKYGDRLLEMGPDAREYFNRELMIPAIEKFFKDCGYR